MGRFMSPDTSDGPDPVPFGDLENPQSLNLYSYVGNNPVNAVDDDGHSTDCGGSGDPSVVCLVTTAIDKIKNFFSGTSVTTSQQDNLNIPAPASPGVPEGASGITTGPLVQAQDAARTNPTFQPVPGGDTHCNAASRCIAGQVGGVNMSDLGRDCCADGLANSIYDRLAHSGNYHRVGASEAQRLANLGKVVFGVYKEPGHGHIVTVRPNNTYFAGSENPTGALGPMINNIGRNVGVVPLSRYNLRNPSVPSAFAQGVIFYAAN